MSNEIVIKLLAQNSTEHNHYHCKDVNRVSTCHGIRCTECPLKDSTTTVGDVRRKHLAPPAPPPSRGYVIPSTLRAQHSKSCAWITSGTTERCTCSTDNPVKAPSHYMLFDGTESIEVIARSMTVSEFRGFCFGNVLKYRLRAGKKSELATMEQDLKKAAFYQELFDKHKDKCYA